MKKSDSRRYALTVGATLLCLAGGGFAASVSGQEPTPAPADQEPAAAAAAALPSGAEAKGVATTSPATCVVYELFDDGETFHYELSCCEEPQHYDLYFTAEQNDVVECENRPTPPGCSLMRIDFRLGAEPCCGACQPDDPQGGKQEPEVQGPGAFGRGLDPELRKRLDGAPPRPPHRPYCTLHNARKEAIKFTIDDERFAGKTFVFYRKRLREDSATFVTVAIEIPTGHPERFEPYHHRTPQVSVDEDLCEYEMGKGPAGPAPFVKVGLKFVGVPGLGTFSDCCFVVLRDEALWRIAGNP